jgi:hypothetical protein
VKAAAQMACEVARRSAIRSAAAMNESRERIRQTIVERPITAPGTFSVTASPQNVKYHAN